MRFKLLFILAMLSGYSSFIFPDESSWDEVNEFFQENWENSCAQTLANASINLSAIQSHFPGIGADTILHHLIDTVKLSNENTPTSQRPLGKPHLIVYRFLSQLQTFSRYALDPDVEIQELGNPWEEMEESILVKNTKEKILRLELMELSFAEFMQRKKIFGPKNLDDPELVESLDEKDALEEHVEALELTLFMTIEEVHKHLTSLCENGTIWRLQELTVRKYYEDGLYRDDVLYPLWLFYHAIGERELWQFLLDFKKFLETQNLLRGIHPEYLIGGRPLELLPERSFLWALRLYIKSRYPLLNVVTEDELLYYLLEPQGDGTIDFWRKHRRDDGDDGFGTDDESGGGNPPIIGPYAPGSSGVLVE